jgi:hypothetical protein
MESGGVNPVSGPPLDQLVKTVSDQAVVVAREQVDLARREMTSKARQAGAGAAMVGGGAFLAVLASGTATAALVLLLTRRPGSSAAALGVSGAYMGAGALLAKQGLARLKEAGPLVPQETVQTAKQDLGSAKRGAKSERKQPGRATPRKPTSPKPRARRDPSPAKRRPAS